MPTDKPTDKQLLVRVDLKTPLDSLMPQVASEYKLEKLIKYELMKVGYEELNIKTNTTKGKFIVKIFHPRPYIEIRDYIKVLLKFSKADIPAPQLLKANSQYLYKTKGKKGSTYICVMKFFEGRNFVGREFTNEDLKILTSYLAKIHRLNFKINRNYDSWGTANLLPEFEKRKKYLKPEDLRLIEPVVQEFRKIDFSKFRKCIIHGDWQKEHVLKNRKGEYCILDLGCMDFNAAIIDLSIFLAMFCFDLDSIKKSQKIYDLVVGQ